jgi:hypothetical protein
MYVFLRDVMFSFLCVSPCFLCISCYHVLCILYNIECQVMIEHIYPYLAGAPRPRRPHRTRGIRSRLHASNYLYSFTTRFVLLLPSLLPPLFLCSLSCSWMTTLPPVGTGKLTCTSTAPHGPQSMLC